VKRFGDRLWIDLLAGLDIAGDQIANRPFIGLIRRESGRMVRMVSSRILRWSIPFNVQSSRLGHQLRTGPGRLPESPHGKNLVNERQKSRAQSGRVAKQVVDADRRQEVTAVVQVPDARMGRG
jgi:hypothetical protein